MARRPPVLIIACGALVREIVALMRVNRWEHMTVQCLPAELHNTLDKIPGAVRDKIRAARGQFAQIFVAYADCGTGGQLDAVLAEEGVDRLPGAHCYELYAGPETYAALADAELGTFYLTDFLARHFDRLVYRGLGLDRHPQLIATYIRHYRKRVYLAHSEDSALAAKAKSAAQQLGLEFDHVVTGYGGLGKALALIDGESRAWQS